MAETKQNKEVETKTEVKDMTVITEDELIESSNKLEQAVYDLLTRQPFIGHLVQLLTRQISKKIPTACVSVMNHRYTLTINPDFFQKLTTPEAAAIITHEVYHLLNEHLKRVSEKEPMIYNVAADMAINQYISDLPRYDREEVKKELLDAAKKAGQKLSDKDVDKILPKPDKEGKCAGCLLPQNYNLPLEKTSEWYYEKIMNDSKLREQFQQKVIRLGGMSKEQQKQLAEDIKSGKVRVEVCEGSHDEWGTAEGTTPEVLDEELKHIVREAMEKSKKDFGRLPAGLQQSIYDMLESKVNWKAQLRSFVQVATRVLREKSRKRPSRRYGVSFPGQKSEFKLNLGVVFDTSGSISDEELKLFLGEVHRINETGMADITIMEADADVHKTYQYKSSMGKFEAHRFYGRGGTDAGPWLKALEDGRYDAGIILTDGYFSFELKKPRTAIMWALTEQGYSVKDFNEGVKFGRKVKLEVDKRKQ